MKRPRRLSPKHPLQKPEPPDYHNPKAQHLHAFKMYGISYAMRQSIRNQMRLRNRNLRNRNRGRRRPVAGAPPPPYDPRDLEVDDEDETNFGGTLPDFSREVHPPAPYDPDNSEEEETSFGGGGGPVGYDEIFGEGQPRRRRRRHRPRNSEGDEEENLEDLLAEEDEDSEDDPNMVPPAEVVRLVRRQFIYIVKVYAQLLVITFFIVVFGFWRHLENDPQNELPTENDPENSASAIIYPVKP